MASNRPVRHHHLRIDVGARKPWRLRRQHQLHLGVRLTDQIAHVASVIAQIGLLHILHRQSAAIMTVRMALLDLSQVLVVADQLIAVLVPRDVAGGRGVVRAVQFGGIADDGVDVMAMRVDAWRVWNLN